MVSLWVPADVVFDARFPSNSRFFNEIRRRISRIVHSHVSVVTLPASSSNHDDDDGDEKPRKGKGLISKNKLNCLASHFWYIFFNRNECDRRFRPRQDVYGYFWKRRILSLVFEKIRVHSCVFETVPSPLPPPHENASIPHRAYVM